AHHGGVAERDALGGRLGCSGRSSGRSRRNGRNRIRHDGLDHRATCGPSPAGDAAAVSPFFLACLARKSAMAALMASSASTEQWIFTGGSESSWAISLLVIWVASSMDLPFTHSVTSELEAIAEPQPKVLKRASSMTPVCSLILSWSRITSPQ